MLTYTGAIDLTSARYLYWYPLEAQGVLIAFAVSDKKRYRQFRLVTTLTSRPAARAFLGEMATRTGSWHGPAVASRNHKALSSDANNYSETKAPHSSGSTPR